MAKKKTNIAAEARKAGLDPQLVYKRIKNGWSQKRTLTTPVKKRTTLTKVTQTPKSTPKSTVKRTHPIIPLPIDVFENHDRRITWFMTLNIITMMTVAVLLYIK